MRSSRPDRPASVVRVAPPEATVDARRDRLTVMDTHRMKVVVPVAGLWAGPDAPRPVDRLALADEPDVVSWLAELDRSGPDGRYGLHDRLESQLLLGEEVRTVGTGSFRRARAPHPVNGWLQVVCPEQTSSKDERGYPGWVRAAHLVPSADQSRAADDHDGDPDHGEARWSGSAGADRFLASARAYGGTSYLWGGLSRHGVDCSGLVHAALRSIGVRVPRDAADQQEAIPAVALKYVRPGDLYFFARPGSPAHHVGIVTANRAMLHAPEAQGVVVEEPLSEERRALLSGAGRLFV